MALFEGTLEEFEKFIGPATNKVVTRLGKQLKKTQKSCQNSTLKNNTPNDEYCGKYKSLDAAHFSHKELDRKSIIGKILDAHFKSDKNYTVDLSQFLIFYEEQHQPLNEKLIMLCRQHHVSYDRFNKSSEADELEINETDEVVSISLNNSQEIDLKTDLIKKQIINQFNYLSYTNCNIARISGKDEFFWNFNIKNEVKNGYLLCLNQFDRTVTVLKYDFLNDQIGNVKKNKNKISLLIPFSETEFKDKGSDYVYEVIECIKLV